MSGRNRDTRKARGKKPLSNGWIVVPSKTYPDRVYFYNTVTRCSTWNNPCEDGNEEGHNSSSSETISSNRSSSFRTKQKSAASHSKKRRSESVLHSPNRNISNRINNEIEDYDDHDQYFTEVPINAFGTTRSHINSPPSSPDSVCSFKTNISDSDNLLLDGNKKQLWAHFVSSPDKLKIKKSVALSDFQEASTSQTSEMEKTGENSTKNISSKNTTKKRKKRQRQTEWEKKKNVEEKVIKTVTFKKCDKTPSQTRLLKLRKQNFEKLKELATKYPELGISGDFNRHSKNSTTVFESEERTGNGGFSDSFLNDTTVSAGEVDHVSVDSIEEMDWEPSSEESDVRNINVFRQKLDKPNVISGDNVFGLNANCTTTLPSTAHSCILVFDTNIFVSCLSFVKELRDTKLSDLGYPVIYVPWRVLQELDRLKDTKLENMDKNLNVNVRRAIAYLNDNFKLRHPRIFGQSFEEFARMIDVNIFAPDDEILQTCIQLQKQHGDKKLVLLTNDKNLESKAIVSGVEVYSKERFQKNYLKSDSVSSSFTNDALIHSSSGGADDCLCQVKALLKDFLTMFVETELKAAFEGDWIKLAVRKPPWSLQDVMKCLLKHWRAVFFLNFSKDIRCEAEQLNEQLFRREAVTIQSVVDIVKTSQRLILSIKKSPKNRQPYLDIIPKTLSKLSNLLTTLSPSQPDAQLSAVPSVSGTYSNPQLPSQNDSLSNDISKVKILFKEIWDSLRCFCCSISDIIKSGPNTEAVIQEIRLKLSQVLNEASKLVADIENILEVNPVDISERNPVIIHFSNFLTLVYPNMVPDLKMELPRCLATFFLDFEGRSLIGTSLKDFKEFIQDLIKATEYFNTQHAC